jgi:lysophospholipase L1-like esterase/aryl-phospho-beta-D-glucosidase BglC (GH1 family)
MLAPLSVIGNRIMRGGKPFELRGVTRDTLEWGDGNWAGCGGDGHLASSDFAAIQTWGANAVRLPLSQANWLGRACDAQAYALMVDSAISAANGAGLYVILDLHWTDVQGQAPCGSGCTSGQQPMPDSDSVMFWSQVGARYASYPGVLFELYNTPHPNAMNGVVQPSEWECWQKGGCMVTSSTNPPVTYEAVGMQALYDAVHSAAPSSVVLAGGPDWASDLSGVLTGYGLTGTNLAYTIHVYTQYHYGTADWDSHFGKATQMFPVVATEFGSLDCSSGNTSALLQYFEAPMGNSQNRMSWTIWGWSAPGSCSQPSVINDWNGGPLVDDANATFARSLGNSQGQLVHDALLASAQSNAEPTATDVLALGDSITYGVNFPLAQSYPGALSGLLGSAYFVMNAGMPGDTVAASTGYPGMTARYEPFATPGEFQYCLFMGGVNDIGRGQSASTTFANATTLFGQIKAAGCKLGILKVTPFRGAPYGYDNPSAQGEAVTYNADLDSYCAANGAACLDTRAAIGDGATPPAILPQYDSGDHLHPNAAGYAALAKLARSVFP